MSNQFPSIRSFDKNDPFKVIFVCLGNICRSPTAEGIMQHLVNERGLGAYIEIASAGTAAYHEGEPANSKSRMVAEKNGVKLMSTAQRLHDDDLNYYDLILAMDNSNKKDITQISTAASNKDKIHLFRLFDPEASSANAEVPDPYYGGLKGFDDVFELVYRSCETLLDHIVKAKK
jgi:protein-tyrosine phosphatase